MYKIIIILAISLFAFTSCDVVVGNNPISEILDFNPKEGSPGDIITIEVDMAYTQEEIDNAVKGVYNYDLEKNRYLIYIENIDSRIQVTEYIEATRQKVICKIPNGARTGYIGISSGMDIDNILDGSLSKEKFIVVDASGDEIW